MAQFFASEFNTPSKSKLASLSFFGRVCFKKKNTIIKIIIIIIKNRRSVHVVDEEFDCSPQKVALKY